MVDEALITTLLREGRHEEAARICASGGQPQRAADLLATAWQWSEAVAIASDAGLFDEAYRHALASGDVALTTPLLADLTARPDQAARAAGFAEAKNRIGDAARLFEAAGELDAATRLYDRAGELADAARCAFALGETKQAGVLYERRLREAPDDTASALALGQILASLGRWDHAARALQRAVDDPAHAIAAGRLLVAAFASMGMTDAAQSRLDALRVHDPALPRAVPEMLAATFGSADGPAKATSEEALLAGRYRVVRALGAGATGRVLLAEDALSGREVAIKALHAGAGAAGRDALARFAREARVMSSVEHPNVVRVLDYVPSGPLLVMEVLPGGTLEDRLVRAEGPLAPAIVRPVARAIASALEAVHRRGIVHRDLKPSNVLFGPTGEVKIGDFGVAHLAELGATQTGAMMGTLAYMAPEQITGSRAPDASTDLYALGILLHRSLTGALPFPGPDFATQHLERTPEPPSRRAPWLDARFDALVAQLLEKDPTSRPRTASEALERLDALPWDEVEREARATLGFASGARAATEPPPSAPAIAIRWQPLTDADPLARDGAALAYDELLHRRVLLVPCDGARVGRARALGSVKSPFVQALFALDIEREIAVIERPIGALASEKIDVDPERVDCARKHLRAAMEALHAVGLVHGSIDANHLVFGPGRAVLWVPLEAREGASVDDDRDACAKLEASLS